MRIAGMALLARTTAVMVTALVCANSPVEAQEKFPSRPIDIVVPFAPGGATDLSARTLGAYITKRWGVNVNVINKPGARGIPQTQELYRAQPDGHTLIAENPTTSSMLAAAMQKDLPFDVFDRTFLGMNTGTPFTVIVAANSPYQSMQQLMEDVKKSPEKISYPSQGSTGTPDYFIRTIFQKAGVDIARAPAVMVTSGAQSVPLTASGNVVMGLAAASTALTAVKGGLVRTLVISSAERDPDFPAVPTTAELGYPVVISWNGLSGPPKMPKHVADAWAKLLKESVEDAEFVANVKKIGAVPFYKDPTTTRAYVKDEIEQAAKLFGGAK